MQPANGLVLFSALASSARIKLWPPTPSHIRAGCADRICCLSSKASHVPGKDTWWVNLRLEEMPLYCYPLAATCAHTHTHTPCRATIPMRCSELLLLTPHLRPVNVTAFLCASVHMGATAHQHTVEGLAWLATRGPLGQCCLPCVGSCVWSRVGLLALMFVLLSLLSSAWRIMSLDRQALAETSRY